MITTRTNLVFVRRVHRHMRTLSEERTRVRFFFMVVDFKAGLLALLVGREDSVDEEEAEPVGLLSVGESVGA